MGRVSNPPLLVPGHLTTRIETMITFRILAVFCILFTTTKLFASDVLMDAGRAATIDFIMEQAIQRGQIAGGIVVIGNRQGILYSTSHGRTSSAPDAPPINDRTLFDIASLTKVFATAPAIMKLLEEGRITLMDPLNRWFPEFEDTGREEITILNLLTHTSGLDDITVPAEAPLAAVIRSATTQKHWRLPGNRFRYADINFILLGELVRRVSGLPLDSFCRDQLFAPLGMADTQFLPPREDAARIAATAGQAGEQFVGVVQDENARRLGGVAGHAGLFSSASDLSRFVVMIMNGGRHHNGRIFSDRVVAQMTAPYFYSNGAVVRGLGWDIYSPYSAPRGSAFSEMSFGHTGYSGSSVWIDPERDLFVLLLTVRLDYRDIRQFNRLRSTISSLAVSVFSEPRNVADLSDLTAIP